MKRTRTSASILNSLVASFGQLLILIFSFISRTVFIKILGENYLGLNGLFTNILNVLSFAELGIGAAMTFSLYKPLALNDDRQVIALMRLYKRAYHLIAIIIGTFGIVLTPFLNFFIKNGSENLGNVKVYFLLFLANSVVSYLWNYKRSIFLADQNGYISSLNTAGFQILTQLVQIYFLITTKNYLIYLIIQIIFTLSSNIAISNLANKYYPILKLKENINVDKGTLNYLKKNILGMMSSKLGGIIVLGTDNIILSSFIGLSAVGMYSNYTLILNGVNSLFNQAISAVTASIGNLQVTESYDKQEKVYFNFSHISAVLAVTISVGLVTLLTPFISVWVGAKYSFDWKLTSLIVIGFYVSLLRQSTINVTNAYGLYWQLRYKSLYEAVINLIASLVFVVYFKLGIASVILGTLLSNILINFWWEPLIVVKYGYRGNLHRYIKFYLSQLVVGTFFILLAMLISMYVTLENIVYSFMLSGVVALVFGILFNEITKRFSSNLVTVTFTKLFLRKIGRK